MTSRVAVPFLAGIVGIAAATTAVVARQARHYALDTAQGLRLENVTAVPATLKGKSGLEVKLSADAEKRMQAMTPDRQASMEQLAVLDGVEFGDGTIEAEIAGTPATGAMEGARGFVGMAFRVQRDLKTYDAFYLRPTNGRAEDQERRNHSAQYISQPDWPWFRLRKETPSRYEAYVDVAPDTWTKIRIDVRSDHARLYVNGQEQPTLVVNDVKSGPHGSGGVALWLGPGTTAHFRDVTITPQM